MKKSLFVACLFVLNLYAELPSANKNGIVPAVNIGGPSRNDITSNSNPSATTGCEDSDKISYFVEQAANKVASEVAAGLYDKDAVNYDIFDCSQNDALKKLSIEMRMSFIGGKFNEKYWLKGNLNVDFDGANGTFIKAKASNNVVEKVTVSRDVESVTVADRDKTVKDTSGNVIYTKHEKEIKGVNRAIDDKSYIVLHGNKISVGKLKLP